ncbi:hypothetical protein H4I96_01117 [Botrytis cinerea]
MCYWKYVTHSCSPKHRSNGQPSEFRYGPKRCEEALGIYRDRYCLPIVEPTPEEKAATLEARTDKCLDCRRTEAELRAGLRLCEEMSEVGNENIDALKAMRE